MIPFVPVWFGYGWEVEFEFVQQVTLKGVAHPPTRRVAEVAFRERNSQRSSTFHLWPFTGVLGVQFVMGIVMTPLMCLYDADDTTKPLLAALGPRFGRTFAGEVYRELERRAR